jgi:transposase-like protein
MTNEQKNQVAAMNASGMSIDEIVLDTGLEKQEVADFVTERNSKRGRPISEQTRQAIVEWYQSGHPVSQTAKKFGVDPKTVKKAVGLLPKEKEPATAATAADSEENIVQVQDTTKTAESQALKAAKAKLLAIYETLSPEECRAWEMGEVYAEVVRGCGE